jgi:enamine deaminase RidA (YjgF/YER057c/UK114 family)
MKTALLPLLLLLSATAEAQDLRFLNPPALPPTNGYTHVVEVPAGHRLVFLSGQIPLDSSGALRGGADFPSQAKQFDDVVKLAFHILDVRKVPELREVRDQYVNTATPPASTLVQVSRLPREDMLLEVEAIAAVPERGGR